jgi:hypothetical protein
MIMYALAHKQRNTYKALTVGITLVYVVITLAVPLLHKDDCPAAPGSKSPGSSLPSSAPCPACKFLAGANATQVHCDSTPVLTQSQTLPEVTRDSQVVIASPCAGSIVLRGPPVAPLS